MCCNYVCMTGSQGDGKPRSAAMVLSMPHTSLSAVLKIVNEHCPLAAQTETQTEMERSESKECADATHQVSPGFSIDPAAFDTVEASCKYNIYLKKQEDEMNRYD